MLAEKIQPRAGRRWALALAIGAFVSMPGSGVRAENRADRRDALDAAVRAHVQSEGFAGSVVVSIDGAAVFEKSYGEANVELGVPVGSETRFRLHSITKTFTATAVALLAHRGKLRLDEPIREVIPELPTAWQPVQVIHLLEHTSGISQLEERWFEQFQEHPTATQLQNLNALLPSLANDKLSGVPGTNFEYNNFGYDLLACLVEKVAAEPFATFVAEKIFNPAGMSQAGFDQGAEIGDGMYIASRVVPRLASGYNGPAGALQVAFPMMFGSAGAGGAYATARDLASYDAALRARRFDSIDLDRESIDRAFRISEKASYGLGWVVRHPSSGVTYLQHDGGNNGYDDDFARYPMDRAAIIVLGNRGAVDATRIRSELQKILFGAKYE
jgi:D-alanyl-D-alanine carboxypeptidase